MTRLHVKNPSELRSRQEKVTALAWVVGVVFAFMSPFAVAQRAILIGVSQFDHLPIKPLEGSPNDVALMASALQSLGILPEKIIQLTDAADHDFLPRRANVLRVLSEQARLSKRGETVIVYFSGHGAQVPQPLPVAKGRWVEPDGLDEVFLTRDTKLWDKKSRKIEGALLDDDIGDALARFTKKGVTVWAIFDTCHAGDMARGTPLTDVDVVWRGVDAGALGVPSKSTLSLASLATLPSQRTVARPPRTSPVRRMNGVVIAFYATQPDESAPEELFGEPAANRDSNGSILRRRYGVFTWELASALSKSPVTFFELSRSITQRYQSRPFPTPQFEGDLSRQLLR